MTSRGRLLVVDDALMVRRQLCHTLRPAGYEVDEAGDGAEAVSALQQTPYALVLLDLEMPRMSGVELLRLLQSGVVTQKPVILVMTSADVTADDLRRLRELGVAGFLEKGCDSEQLLFRVKSALAQAGATE